MKCPHIMFWLPGLFILSATWSVAHDGTAVGTERPSDVTAPLTDAFGRTTMERATDVINVADFGKLRCDGSTDDSTTINAALSAWRTTVNRGNPAVLWFPHVGSDMSDRKALERNGRERPFRSHPGERRHSLVRRVRRGVLGCHGKFVGYLPGFID